MYKETEKKINDIVSKYGETRLRIGISFLKEVGYGNINDETIAAEKEKIINRNKNIEANGNKPLVTTEFLVDAIDIAYQLSFIDSEELNVYIQENIHYGVEQGIIPKKRLLVLLKNALTIIYEDIDNPICFIETLSSECEFTDDEIESLGYESLLDDYYNLCEKDDGMV